MYNFPHQINDLGKLHAALAVFSDLDSRGRNIDDDGVVGTAMARARVYAFRDKNLSLRKALEREHKKARSSQGTRTFARDLRRFFALLGFLRTDIAGATELSPMGIHLLGLAPLSDEARAVWRTALRHVILVDPDDRGISHPYSLLLRLVEERPGLEASRLALALEARNDSMNEFRRVLRLADLESWADARKEMGVSEHFARDATKILPALAKQLGELSAEGNKYYRVEPSEINETGTAGVPATVVRRHRRSRRSATKPRRGMSISGGSRKVNLRTIARAPRPGQQPPDEIEYADPALTAELRRERLERHQQIVRAVASKLGQGELYSDPYDVLRVAPDNVPAVLGEIKTLDGTEPDEITQVRAAFAQLLYYDAFHIPVVHREKGLVRVAVFERPVNEHHVAFLESFSIAVAWIAGDQQLHAAGWSLGILRESDVEVVGPE